MDSLVASDGPGHTRRESSHVGELQTGVKRVAQGVEAAKAVLGDNRIVCAKCADE